MPLFQVSVCRTGYSFASIEVEAESVEEAETTAIDLAGDLYFSERESEYSSLGATLIGE